MLLFIQILLGAATLIAFPASIAAEPSGFSPLQICRATIGAVMGRDPRIIKLDKAEASIIYVSYIRTDDRTVWKQRCRVDGTKVIWGTDTGRWREHPLDEVITYAATPTTLTIHQKFTDGSSSAKPYTRAQLSAN